MAPDLLQEEEAATPGAIPMALFRAALKQSFSAPVADESRVAFWRQSIMAWLLFAGAAFGWVAYLPSLVMALHEHLWSVAVVDTLAYGWVVAAALGRQWTYAVRARGLLLMLYLVCMTLLAKPNTSSAGLLWVTVLPVLAAVFLDLRAAFTSWLVNLVTIAACGWAMASGRIEVPAQTLADPHAVAAWLVTACSSVFLSGFVALPSAIMLHGLEQTHRALSREEERFTRVFQLSPEPIAIRRKADGRFLDVNGAWSNTFGWSREEVLGRTTDDLGLWATGTERIRLETELMATGALAPQALDLFRKDGSTVPVLLSARMLDLEGEACLLVISQDLTAAGEAEAERRRLELELQHAQKLESLGGLAGGVAHDMNNNLAGILGLSSLLQHQYTADLVLAKGLAGINLLRSTTRQKIDLIGLQSKVGEGTQVVLSFPPLEAERTIPHPEPPPSLPAEMAPLSVLVVDDDPIIQETLPDLLAFLGHATHSATRGQEALDLLATGLEVDLVILDHNMPGLSGAETLVRLRAIRPDLPVLLSTGFLEPGVEALAQRFQKVWLLNKPYSLAAIRAKLVGIAAQRASGFR